MDGHAFLISFFAALVSVHLLGVIGWFLFCRLRRKAVQTVNPEVWDIERPRDSPKSSLHSHADPQSVSHAASQRSALSLSRELTLRSISAEDIDNAEVRENVELDDTPGNFDVPHPSEEMPLAQILAEARSREDRSSGKLSGLAESSIGQAELPANHSEGRSFNLKIGHCPRGLRQDSQLVYVEPAELSLPLHLLVDAVKVHQRGMNPVSCSRNNYIETAGGRFECWTTVPNLEPSFKVEVTWKDGLGMTLLSQEIMPCTAKPFSAELQIPVKLPDVTHTVAKMSLRRDLQQFLRCLEHHEAKQSFQMSQHRRSDEGQGTE